VTSLNVSFYSRTGAGIAVALSAAAAFAVANTSTNVAYHGGSNALTVAATRFLVPSAAIMLWLRASGLSPLLPKRDALVAALLGAVTALYSWALLRSFSSIPFALAILIFYLFPLMAAVIAAALGWEKFAWRTGGAIMLAIAGLALALDVHGGRFHAEGVSLAFLAAIGLAVVVAVSGRALGKGDARRLTLYMAAAASVLLLVLCVASGSFALPSTAPGWIGFAAATTLYGYAMIAFFIAISMIGPVRTSLLSYADAVMSAALGVAVLGQALTFLQIAGIAVVVLALVGATQPRDAAAKPACRSAANG
jgi:drug/metabolite transporter (DMT)-like permease